MTSKRIPRYAAACCIVVTGAVPCFAQVQSILVTGDSVPTGRIWGFDGFYGEIEDDGDVYIHTWELEGVDIGAAIYRWSGAPALELLLRDGFLVGASQIPIVVATSGGSAIEGQFGITGPNEIVAQVAFGNSTGGIIKWSPTNSSIVVDNLQGGSFTFPSGHRGRTGNSSGDIAFTAEPPNDPVPPVFARILLSQQLPIEILLANQVITPCGFSFPCDPDSIELCGEPIAMNGFGDTTIALRDPALEYRSIIEYTGAGAGVCRHTPGESLAGLTNVRYTGLGGIPINDDREIVFAADADQASALIVLPPDPAGAYIVAQSLQPFPGLPGLEFGSFNPDPDINNRGDVVFTGRLTDVQDRLMFYDAITGEFSILATRGDVVPNRTPQRTFTSFFDPHMNDDRQIVFRAGMDNGLDGAFFVDGPQVSCIPPGSDCNSNGVDDSCDIAGGTSLDSNLNTVPDECELAGGTSADCNGGGVLDECDITGGTSLDCNLNVVPDECELSGNDCNGNGVPDECDGLVPGDADGDGDVDASDLDEWVLCITGPLCDPAFCPTAQYPANCCNADIDGDGDVDLRDFALFVRLVP